MEGIEADRGTKVHFTARVDALFHLDAEEVLLEAPQLREQLSWLNPWSDSEGGGLFAAGYDSHSELMSGIRIARESAMVATGRVPPAQSPTAEGTKEFFRELGREGERRRDQFWGLVSLLRSSLPLLSIIALYLLINRVSGRK